jgi:hypothetical protein
MEPPVFARDVKLGNKWIADIYPTSRSQTLSHNGICVLFHLIKRTECKPPRLLPGSEKVDPIIFAIFHFTLRKSAM